ncbi:MAG: cell division topological specificity factor MinE [Bdellovibrionales bacterium]|nr:cell division topological specificity factor MinE [Bdellovibrionales bacterium]
MFRSENDSKSKAKSRLHFVLVQDRSGLTNDEMADFKKDLIGVIGRYFDIDESSVGIEYQRESNSTTLVINSPVLRRKLGAIDGGSKKGAAQAAQA